MGKVEQRCNKCGKHQEPDKSRSNGNWDVFPVGAPCSCGGKFVMHIDGEPIGGVDNG